MATVVTVLVFDEYLADGFYMEEFAKYYSNLGTMLLVVRAGAPGTWRQIRVWLLEKRCDGSRLPLHASAYYLPSYRYPRWSAELRCGMGDLPSQGINDCMIFGHSFVTGYLNPAQLPTDPKLAKRIRPGGNGLFSGSRMNGQFAESDNRSGLK